VIAISRLQWSPARETILRPEICQPHPCGQGCRSHLAIHPNRMAISNLCQSLIRWDRVCLSCTKYYLLTAACKYGCVCRRSMDRNPAVTNLFSFFFFFLVFFLTMHEFLPCSHFYGQTKPGKQCLGDRYRENNWHFSPMMIRAQWSYGLVGSLLSLARVLLAFVCTANLVAAVLCGGMTVFY
jgi:hypothetical protein